MTDTSIMNVKKWRQAFFYESWGVPTIVKIGDSSWVSAQGGVWVQVPNCMTIEEVRAGWVQMKEPSLFQEWFVQSRSGTGKYKVRRTGDRYTCTCLGFTWREQCWHVKKKMEDNSDILIKNETKRV